MVPRRSEALHKGDPPPGVERGGEDHLLKEIERQVPGAGESHHQAPGLDEFHGEEIDVLITARGALDVATALGECRRIANDEIEAARRLANVLERVSNLKRGVDSVERVIASRTFDRRRG